MVKKKSEHAEDIVINAWPSTTDCVDWSEDGQIVVAAGDDIHLLIPKVNTLLEDAKALWEPIRLRVTSFSPEEVHPQTPISAASFSIGEEISAADVVAAKWTPQGIAENQRCALLIHTQNLILSIWTSSQQPQLERAWRRRALINDHIRQYVVSQQPDLQPKDGKVKEELRLKIRVRAFAMSEIVVATNTKQSDSPHPYILIATSNDAKEVIITACQGSGTANPDLQTMHSFSIANPASAPALAWTFDEYMENTRFIQHLAWSPWVAASAHSRSSLIACGIRKKLCFRLVELSHDDGGTIFKSEEFHDEVALKQALSADALLKWLPVREGGLHELLLCSRTMIAVFTVDFRKGSKIKSKVWERSEWSQIAGFHVQHEDERRLQILPSSTKQDHCITTLGLPELGLQYQTSNYFTDALKYHRASLDPRYKHVNDQITTRVWGIAKSPLSDLNATVVTFHPSYAPEYVIPADMSAIVLFQHNKQTANLIGRAVRGQFSAEALTMSIKWIFKNIESEGDRNMRAWEMYNEVETTMTNLAIPKLVLATSSFHDMLFNTGELKKSRFERLIGLVINGKGADATTEKLIVEILVKLIIQTPETRYALSKMTKTMLSIMQQILVNMQLKEATEHNEDETCTICEETIQFQDFRSAQCLRGHQFRRCAISFLSIQEPNVSKMCGICGKQYLQATHIENQATDPEVEVSKEQEAASSLRPLAQALADACRQCVYCGGKLVG